MPDLQSRFYACLCHLVKTHPKKSAGSEFLTEIAHRLHLDIQHYDLAECSDHYGTSECGPGKIELFGRE